LLEPGPMMKAFSLTDKNVDNIRCIGIINV
jgi:hypothetical protein